MTAHNLLVELFVEELPPKALKLLGNEFAASVVNHLLRCRLTQQTPEWQSFATPRRLAVLIRAVEARATDRTELVKVMPVSAGLTAEGQPTPALLKKLAALGVEASVIPKLSRAMDGKNETLFLERVVLGITLASGLQEALEEAIRKLPIPKVMSYQLADGWSTVKFVRPAHGLVALHGTEVVPISLLGLDAGRITHGHRFEAKSATLELASADSYEEQLATEGAVIASFAKRRDEISKQLLTAATKTGLKISDDDALLDEVTALVERPNVLTCEFEKEFLQVPGECLVLTMKANQKYFPLFDTNNKLSNRFLVVSNISPADTSRVIEGNERVVRPRLADAKFFFDQDRKRPLISHLDALSKVVYHNKLGSQRDRVQRIEALAEFIFEQLPVNSQATKTTVKEAAQLCKCDLLTLMVGEFPELQGVMGCYYALADGKSSEIAEAIREHYLPRGAGDELPATNTGIALALADKIDTIAGVFVIDQKPTGAKDPFGVRRAAIGVLRIIIERQLVVDVAALIHQAVQLQPLTAPENVESDIYDYVMERLRNYYLEDSKELATTTEMFDAVLANRPASPLDFDRRLRALHSFLQMSDAQSLAAANKRIGNILRKSGQEVFNSVNEQLLHEPAEKALHEQVVVAKKITAPLFASREYAQVFTQLAELRPVVDAFFDSVMVMHEQKEIRENRLALLNELRQLFLRIADLSRLPG